MRTTCVNCKLPMEIIDTPQHEEVFCKQCKQHKCLHCLIVLSKKYRCHCGAKHGLPSEVDGRYCNDCWESGKIEPTEDEDMNSC